MALPTIKQGDAVKLLRPVYVSEEEDTSGNKVMVAYALEPTPKKPWKVEQLSINSSPVGLYISEVRIKQKDHRAARGFLRKLCQRFFFNGQVVVIDPSLVEVVSRFEDAEEVSVDE